MQFNVIIPARLASTRLPNKPLANINGKPMVVRVANQAQLSGAKEVIVATDDEMIVKACEQYGVRAVMTRRDHVSGTDRIAQVASQSQWSESEVIVNVQGDEPLIDPDLIYQTAQLITSDVPMATAAHVLEQPEDIFNPNYVKVVLDKNNKALYFSRAAIPWYRDGYALSEKQYPLINAYRHVGLYAFRNDFLKRYATLEHSPLEQIESLEQLRVLWNGYPIAVHISKTIPAAGVDTMEDLERVRAILNK